MYKLDQKILEKMRVGEGVTIVAYGDSVTEGSYLKEFGKEKNWVKILEEELQARFGNRRIKVINKGIDGAIARDGYNSFHRVIEERPDLVTVMFAHNDRDTGVAVDIFKSYLKKTVLGLRKYTGAQVLLLTPNALLDQEYDRKTKPYLKALVEVSKELKAELVDVHGFMKKRFASGVKREDCFYKPEDFLKAGYRHIDKEELHLQVIVHPNQKGHQLIAVALMEFEE